MKTFTSKPASRSFAFFCANLQRLMPQIPFKEHGKLFQLANRYLQIATDDAIGWKQIHLLQAADEMQSWMDQPGIVATFHTGPYRMLAMWLMQQQVPLTMIVSADVAKKQGAHNRSWHARIAGSHQSALFETVMAEDPTVLLKMGRALRNGRFILMYIDGNTGAATQPNGKRSFCLDFLGQPLLVKTGVAELSYLNQVPIYPVLPTFNTALKPRFLCRKAIYPDRNGDRRVYVRSTMLSLYQWLADFLRQEPMQWEGWFYVHHDLKHPLSVNSPSFFNHYLPFELNGKYFLLHKNSLMSFAIEQKMFDYLNDKCRKYYFF